MTKARQFAVVLLITFLSMVGIQPSFSQVPSKTEEPIQYKIDKGHSSIVFAVSHFGISYVYGRFNDFSGNFALQGGELTTSGFSFIVNAKTIDTNNSARDKHLRSREFFDTEQFPKIKFVTTGFTKVDSTYQITGDLTMHGQTRSVTMPVKLVGIGKGPFDSQRAGYMAKFTLKRDAFGIDKLAGQIGNNIAVTFSFVGVKQR